MSLRTRFAHHGLQLFVACNQLANVLLGGWADETLSSRTWRLYQRGKPFGRFFHPVINTVFIWQTWKFDHCKRSYESELDRAQVSPAMRGAP